MRRARQIVGDWLVAQPQAALAGRVALEDLARRFSLETMKRCGEPSPAVEILAEWDPAMSGDHKSELVAARGRLDRKTVAALLDLLDLTAVRLTTIDLALAGHLVARGRNARGEWLFVAVGRGPLAPECSP